MTVTRHGDLDFAANFSLRTTIRAGIIGHGCDDCLPMASVLIGFDERLIVRSATVTIRLTSLLLVLSLVAPATAVDIWYSFEGDSAMATDQLTGDGSQNGIFENNVSVQNTAPFGNNSALFEIPGEVSTVNPPFSTFEVPGSTGLGEDFTIALHADNQEATLGFTRLVTSYRGTGGVGNDRIILDYDPTGGVIPGIRAIVNNTVVQTGSPPAGSTDPGYHHYALTVDSGDVRIYFDGSEVAAGNVGSGYTNTHNLLIGEDPHDGGGSANEQFLGYVDEVLVLNRALGGADILALAGGPVADVVTPSAGDYAVYYDFEDGLADRFDADGAQSGIANLMASVGNANARFGSGAGLLEEAVAGGSPFSRIAVGNVGNLGSSFTLSATIDVPQSGYSGEGLTRLFSTFAGTGSPAGRLIFDFNPDADVADIGLRVILPDGTSAVAGDMLTLNEKHTLTATYDNGDLRVYLDGNEVASASTSGDVDLGEFPLFIGEDNDERGLVNENFIGTLDDALILGRALSAAEVAVLHAKGFAAVPEPSTAGLLFLGAAVLGRARRRR